MFLQVHKDVTEGRYKLNVLFLHCCYFKDVVILTLRMAYIEVYTSFISVGFLL